MTIPSHRNPPYLHTIPTFSRRAVICPSSSFSSSLSSCLVLSCLVLSCLSSLSTCQTLVKPTKPATEPVTVHSPSHRRQHLGWALGYFRALAFPTNDIATNYTLHFCCIPRWLLSYFGAHGPCMINIFLSLFFSSHASIHTHTHIHIHTKYSTLKSNHP